MKSPATTSAPRPLFTLNGKSYYLVTVQREDSTFGLSLDEIRDAITAAGHVPAVVRDAAILGRDEMRPIEDSVLLFDCRPGMLGKKAAFLIPERHRTLFPEKYHPDTISDEDRRIDLGTSKGLSIYDWTQLQNEMFPRPVLCWADA